MELEIAIENLKKQLENTKKANECGLATKGEFKEDIEAIETVLKHLEYYQEKVEKYKFMLSNDVIPKKKIKELVLYLKLLKRHISLNDEQRKGYDVCIEEIQKLLEDK